MKSEAAFYLPIEKLENEKADYNQVAKTENSLLGAFAKSHIKKLNIDTFKFSKYLSLQGQTEFAQRYATGALTKIINGEPITNKTMLDSLFNTYAPAFNATLEQTGYNSIVQMKDAAAHGTINVSTFLSGFSNGLSAIQEERDFLYRSQKYGEEIPVDLVTKCDINYESVGAEHPHDIGKNFMDYIKDFGPVNIKVSAHVKNETAEAWNINDYSNKLTDAMVKKEPVVFRIGNTIYEDVVITKYHPVITNIYDISFDVTIQYNYLLARESKFSKDGIRVVNAAFNKDIESLLAETEYIGPGLVEEVTAQDMGIISQMKKFLGRDKIIINGEEL